MNDLNRTTLLGRLGQKPELKKTGSGISVCTLSIATNETWRDANGNEKKKTTWHRVSCWRKLAEWCAEKLPVGARLLVEGPTEERSYTDKTGAKHFAQEVRAFTVVWTDQPKRGKDDSRDIPPPSDEDAPPPPTDDDIPF